MLLYRIKPYWPLIVVTTLSVILPVALHAPTFMVWMHQVMGFFLVMLGMLKAFDVRGFKNGFAKYDLITPVIPAYGFVYPFIEIGLGLLYIAQKYFLFTNMMTMLIMGIGLLGVSRSIWRGQTLNCACMGNILQVPLSTVSVIENLSMLFMALGMVVYHIV